MHRTFVWIFTLVSLMLPGSAQGRRAPTPLSALLRGKAPAAIVRVTRVQKSKLLGLTIAHCKIERRLRGLKRVQRLAFVAERLRSSDRSHAIAGERALVFLQRPVTKRVRKAARLLAGMVDSVPPVVLFRLAAAGSGRLPLVRRSRAGKAWHARVGHLRLSKAQRGWLQKDARGLATLVPLAKLEAGLRLRKR